MSKLDYLIIGSGVAATAVAHSILLEKPETSILMIEAGPKVKLKDFGLWTNYMVSGQLPYDPFKDLNYPARDTPGENSSVGGTELPLIGARVFSFGGTTIHWGGWSFRLKPEDFQLFSKTGEGLDWPIPYKDFEPYYGRAEHFIGVSGDSKDDPAFQRTQPFPFPAFPYTAQDEPVIHAFKKLEIGYSNLPMARHGVGTTSTSHAPCQTTGTCKYCPFGARFAATNTLNDMSDWGNYPNFAIETDSIVLKINMSSRNEAEGVTYLRKTDGVTQTVTANRIVLAAGAIESAKLLQRSRGDSFWKSGIGNDNDLVGRFIVTHPYIRFTGSIPENPKLLQPEMNFPTLCSRHYDSEAEQKKGKFILVNPSENPSVNLAKRMKEGKGPEEIKDYVSGKLPFEIHSMVEVFSRHKNFIKEHDKLNHMGMKETYVDYTKDDGFDQRVSEIGSVVKKIFEAVGATMEEKPNVSWRADHAACICRMSESDKDGVVDKNLKVHGVDNLYVCSNAVFPSAGAVNPTLTLTALALRLGDHLNAG